MRCTGCNQVHSDSNSDVDLCPECLAAMGANLTDLPKAPLSAPISGIGQYSATQEKARPAIAASSLPSLEIQHFNPFFPEGLQLIRVVIRNLVAAEVYVSFNANKLKVEVDGGGNRCRARATDADAKSFAAEIQIPTTGVLHGTHKIRVMVECLRDRRVERRYHQTFPFLVLPPNLTVEEVRKIYQDPQMPFNITDRTSLDMRDDIYLRQLMKSDLLRSSMRPQVATWKASLDLDLTNAASEERHPCQCIAACLRSSEGSVKHIRLFAFDKFLLGRLEDYFDSGDNRQQADILLAACPGGKPDKDGPTRRISGSHMIVSIRNGRWHLENVSKNGTAVDRQPAQRGTPIALWPRQRIMLAPNYPGVTELNVRAATPHALYLERSDAGSGYEMLVLLAPNISPDLARRSAPANVPVFMHSRGGFWMLGETDEETPLLDGMEIALEDKQANFVANPYPDLYLKGYEPGAALRNEKN